MVFELSSLTEYLYLDTMTTPQAAKVVGKLGPDKMSPPCLNLDPELFLEPNQLWQSVEVVFYPENRSYYLQDPEIEGDINHSFSYDL